MADDKPDPRTLQQSVKEAWLSFLGVFGTAETELNKASARLLETLGFPADEKGEHNIAAELMARMRKNRDEFERRVDEGVKNAVAKVRAPLDKEIAQLKTRLETLHTRFDELQRRGKRGQRGNNKDG
jgi:polyhydroxyalkanoate synthesis regulator phasin